MNQFDILYFNIAGLSTNYVALRQIVEDKRPFLVFLSETHIVDLDAFEQYSIPGYNYYYISPSSSTTYRLS